MIARTLRMSDEIHDWLVDLGRSDPAAAARVGRALTALMTEGSGLGEPLVSSIADAWPEALADALDWCYQEILDQMNLLGRHVAEAAWLVKDIQDQLAEGERGAGEPAGAEPAGAEPAGAEPAGAEPAGAEPAAGDLGEVRRLLPGAIKARDQLIEARQRAQARADAFRVRKEVLKARYVAAQATLLISETIDDADLPVGAARAGLGDIVADIGQELGRSPSPEGLMELRPGAPWDTGISILFAFEPADTEPADAEPADADAGTALLLAVLEGPEAIRDQYHEALLLAADVLRRVRTGEAPEATARAYADPESLNEEFAFGRDPG